MKTFNSLEQLRLREPNAVRDILDSGLFDETDLEDAYRFDIYQSASDLAREAVDAVKLPELGTVLLRNYIDYKELGADLVRFGDDVVELSDGRVVFIYF